MIINLSWNEWLAVIANVAAVVSFILSLIIKSEVTKIKASISNQYIKGSRNNQAGGDIGKIQ